jgi:UDP-N-acetylmuramate dehydrogenase
VLGQLEEIVGADSVYPNEMMSKHTTFEIGGRADYFVLPKDKEALGRLLVWCKQTKMPYLLLGEGSNILISDEGIEGLVISTKKINQIEVSGDIVYADCGVSLAELSKHMVASALTGLEFSCGIPGSLGGAIYMNAGAYDGEMKDVVLSVDLVDEEGNFFTYQKEEMAFAYRYSILYDKPYYCLGAKMKLKASTKEAVAEKIRELTKKRESKQPLDKPSAGSTFKRPEGYYAGKLIIEAGMQGAHHGGAMVSDKHAGFIVNAGGATAQDVLCLIDEVREAVYKHSGVLLEPEVRLRGRQMKAIK